MSNSVAAYFPDSVCTILSAYDSMNINKPMVPYIPNGISAMWGVHLVRKYNEHSSLNSPLILRTALKYFILVPTAFNALRSFVEHSLYTGCSVKQIANIQGKTESETKKLFDQYFNRK